MHFMKKIVAIVGPTAVGKTRLAVEIQKKVQIAELVSVDSRQIYIGMNIGTGKDAKIFGTDLTHPDKLYNVADYYRVVKPHIQKLLDDGKLPILVGGTGLYLQALIDGIETMEIPPNEEIRKKYGHATAQELQKILVSMYPYIDKDKSDLPRGKAGKLKAKNLEEVQKTLKMNNSDWNNPRRLIRKIELLRFYEKSQKPNFKFQINSGLQIPNCKLIIIGLAAPLPVIKQNIERRVRERLDAGLIEEIKRLVEIYGWNEVLRNTIAYKEWEDYFSGKITREEAIVKWIKDEFDYAKRQLTWFKKDRRIVWLADDYLNDTLKIINSA